MFQEWLKDNSLADYDLSHPLFPPACDRAFWDSKSDAALVRKAECYQGYNWPVALATDFIAFRTEGNRIKQEKIHFARRNALHALALGELCEYKKRFLPDMVNGIFAICEETFWGISAHYPDGHSTDLLPDAQYCYIDLFAAETGALLATIYHLFYDELEAFCPQILPRMEYELERRIVKPYLSHTDFWWMGYRCKVNNWNPWILSNLLTVFLVTQNKTTLHTALPKMLRELDFYCKDLPDDGGCDEGACYWTVAGGTLFEFCEQLYTASDGKIDFFSQEKIQNTGKYIYKTYIGNGYFANFADGTPRITHSLESLVYLFGKRIADPKLTSLSRESVQDDSLTAPELKRDTKIRRSLYCLIYASEILAQPDFVPEESCSIDSIQNAFIRQSGWYCAAKGGHNNESHNHNDIGSFILYRNSKPVLIDPSCGTYTAQTFGSGRYDIWTMQSAWHNLPQINGCDQLPGKDHRADSFRLSGKTASIGFAPAYPEEAGLDSVLRQISLSDDGLTVTDEFSFKKDRNQITEHFMTILPVEVAEDRIILDNRFVLQSNVPGQIAVDSVFFGEDPKLAGAWNTDHMNRIAFRFDTGKTAKLNFILHTL